MNATSKHLWYPRTVFFVKDAQRAMSFYTERLGSTVDWSYEHDGRAFVFQVNLHGVELILNQVEDRTETRAGHGRIFVGLDDDQVAAFRQYVEDRALEIKVIHWGEPTIVIQDLDGNELFFWLSESEREKLRSEIDGSA